MSDEPASVSISAAEANILSKIRPFQRKSKKKQVRYCHRFQLGNCPYSSSCKFLHALDPDAEPPSAETPETPADVASSEDAHTLTMKTGTVVDRYFTRRYAVDCGGVRGNDFFVHEHSNHILIVGLAPTHPIVRCGLAVTTVTYAPAQDLPASRGGLRKLRVSGKRKRGAPHVDPPSLLATARTADGSEWPLLACQRGSVIEINKSFDSSPDLLRTASETLGWLAILAPISNAAAAAAENAAMLLCAEDYARLNVARGQLPVSLDVPAVSATLPKLSETKLEGSPASIVCPDVIGGPATEGQ